METEINVLYNATHSYKESLIKSLDNIDTRILQAIHTFQSSHIRNTPFERFKITMQMIVMLQQYIKMVHTCDLLSEEISSKFADVENDVEPERDKPHYNPFHLPAVTTNCDIMLPLIIKTEQVSSSGLSTENGPTSTRNTPVEITPTVIIGLHQFANMQELNNPSETVIREEGESETQVLDVDQDTIIPDELMGEDTNETESSRLNLHPERTSLESVIEAEVFNTDDSDESDESPDSSKYEYDPKDLKLFMNSGMVELSSDEDNQHDAEEDMGILKPRSSAFLEPNPFFVARSKPFLLDLLDDTDASSNSAEITGDCVGTTKLTNAQQIEEPDDSAVQESGGSRAESAVGEMENCFNGQRTREFLSTLSNHASKDGESPKYDDGVLEQRRQVTFKRDIEEIHKFEREDSEASYQSLESRMREFACKNLKKTPKERHLAPLPSEKLCVGQLYNVCHVKSPSEFYVRSDQASFEAFESTFVEDMHKHHQYVVNQFKSKTDAKYHFGNFCCGFVYKRNKWFRVEVLDWMENDPSDDILVQLMDYGEKALWLYNSLKQMNESYVKARRMAIQCHLAGVNSPNAGNKRKWPKSSTEFFTKSSEIAKKTQFVTIFVYKEGDSYAVDLRKANEPNSDSLGKLLVLHKHASEVEFSQDDCQIYNKETTSTGSVAHGPPTQAPASFVLPSRGQYVEVLITAYITTSHFYVQIFDQHTGHVDAAFLNLTRTMNSEDSVQSYEPFIIIPKMQELVLVEINGEWHRGRCVGCSSNLEIEVFLEDFGYSSKTTLTSLRKMRDEFLTVPFQAVECVLSNCKEKKGATDSKGFFSHFMWMKVFKGLVIDSVKPLKIELWDAQRIDMGIVLQQYGLAEN